MDYYNRELTDECGMVRRGIAFFDLDGTLLDNKLDLISESTLKALRRLRENGYAVVLSTGRDMDTHYSVRYKSIVAPDAIIHNNGNRITVGDSLLFRHTMDGALVRKIYEFCRDNGYCIGTSIGSEDFFVNPEKKRNADLSYKKTSERNFVPFEEIFKRNLVVTAFSFAGDIAKEKPVIEGAFPEIRLLPFNGGMGADVVETGYSKAEGLKKLCAFYGVDPENTYAFGDSQNDIELIKAAGTGIAMGNADESVKAIADYITDDLRHDGIFNACVHFGLIR